MAHPEPRSRRSRCWGLQNTAELSGADAERWRACVPKDSPAFDQILRVSCEGLLAWSKQRCTPFRTAPELKISGVGKFKLIADESVQTYVTTIGQALIPSHQRALATDDHGHAAGEGALARGWLVSRGVQRSPVGHARGLHT